MEYYMMTFRMMTIFVHLACYNKSINQTYAGGGQRASHILQHRRA